MCDHLRKPNTALAAVPCVCPYVGIILINQLDRGHAPSDLVVIRDAKLRARLKVFGRCNNFPSFFTKKRHRLLSDNNSFSMDESSFFGLGDLNLQQPKQLDYFDVAYLLFSNISVLLYTGSVHGEIHHYLDRFGSPLPRNIFHFAEYP